jgi:hypothetical protein
LDAGNITHGATEVGLAPGGSAPAGTTTTGSWPATRSTPAIVAPAMFTAPAPGMRASPLPCCLAASARRSNRVP